MPLHPILTLAVFSLLTSCTTAEVPVVGTYTSPEVGFLEAGWERVVNKALLVQGSRLELTPEGRFAFSDCATLTTGTWELRQDSLYLYGQAKTWKTDSLQNEGYQGRWPRLGASPEVYYRLSNGNLEQVQPYNHHPDLQVKVLLVREE
jgi:hypothetical protein